MHVQVQRLFTKNYIVNHLLQCFKDVNVSVYKAASEAILKTTNMPDGFQTIMQVGEHKMVEIMGDIEGLITTRGIDFLGQIAAQSHTNAEQVIQSGLLNSLLKALSDEDDPLMQVTSLALMEDVTKNLKQEHFRSLCRIFVPPILNLVRKFSWGQVDPVTTSALGVCANLLRDSLNDTEEEAVNSENSSQFLQLLSDSLTREPEMGNSSLSDVVDAVGSFGSSFQGSSFLTLQNRQLLKQILKTMLQGEEGLRICAAHAIASIYGVERIYQNTFDVSLNQTGETILQEVWKSMGDIMQVCAKWLSVPSSSVYIAVYRMLSAVCVRVWAAEELCHNPSLINNILEPSSDFDVKVKNWRYSVILTLTAALDIQGVDSLGASSSSSLQKMSGSIREAARQGPYRAGTGTLRTHLVATIP
eukprot:TRINITY_DN12314_c0_g1_i1.p1 TRINITY_DN12314_c0_g1~~TRINITY_DN12314_c0_g1_i1.p1  ORF type:complete len:416 (-),score=60.11 TRINITY_DN12314_c0_g1_i1:1269-2516(-)